MFRLAPSVSRLMAPATVTTPWLVDRELASRAVGQRVRHAVGGGIRVGGGGSDPHQRSRSNAFSFTAFAVPSLSTGAVTANSFASLIAIVNVCLAVDVSAEVARTVMLGSHRPSRG